MSNRTFPLTTMRKLSNGETFRTYQNSANDEVYGWREDAGGHIVKGSGGWWRTADPRLAFETAEMFVIPKVNPTFEVRS